MSAGSRHRRFEPYRRRRLSDDVRSRL